MPLAFQYGQPLDEFWHGDLRLLEARQKAYMRDKSYTAWLIGAKVFEANSKVSHNTNRTKRTDKVEQYDDWKDPIETMTKARQKEKQQDDNVTQHNQNMWFYNMLHNK